MPRLWDETIDAHRRSVRDATLDAAAALAARHGLRAVTMSQIAAETGIGRATLYKYFPDVESILLAWHERQITGHLEHLDKLRNLAGPPGERLQRVLEAYALIHHDFATRHGKGRFPHHAEIAALLHRGEHVDRAQQHLRALITELLTECVEAGAVRDDVPAAELASYCLHTLTAASDLPSKAAVHRLVDVTVAGLRPPD